MSTQPDTITPLQRRLEVALWLTGLYVCVVAVAPFLLQDEQMALADWGYYLTGFIAPLVFAWIVAVVFMQRRQLEMQGDALDRLRAEVNKSALGQRELSAQQERISKMSLQAARVAAIEGFEARLEGKMAQLYNKQMNLVNYFIQYAVKSRHESLGKDPHWDQICEFYKDYLPVLTDDVWVKLDEVYRTVDFYDDMNRQAQAYGKGYVINADMRNRGFQLQKLREATQGYAKSQSRVTGP
ncbi:hypothetical protein [Aestuariispira ectoiniformans]|uniref:hypothetical protein n=1 Tax=Aestuariispira ectoiniformans TaxID=2775080 RepID=UPI00223B7F89|nr:hypothetical protein [Aestuariispira ectoiniformans]